MAPLFSPSERVQNYMRDAAALVEEFRITESQRLPFLLGFANACAIDYHAAMTSAALRDLVDFLKELKNGEST